MSDSTDDPTHDMSVVASAYLDGEATPEERAWVESNAEALTEVERLRELRSVLGATVQPAPVSVREAQLAAALDVWDRMSEAERSGASTPAAGIDAAAAAAVSTPPPSLAARRERRPTWETPRWLLGAAAGLLVLVGAGLVARSAIDRSDDDGGGDAVSTAEEEPASELDTMEAEVGREFLDENTGDEPPLDVDADNVAGSGGLETEAVQPAAPEDLADAPAAEAAEDADDGAVVFSEEEAADDTGAAAPGEEGEQAEPPPDLDIVELRSAADLADYGAFAAYAGGDVPVASPTATTCGVELGIDRLATPAIYRGTQVSVGIDLEAMRVRAFLPDDCTLVDDVPLPSQAQFEAGRGTVPFDTSGTPADE